MPKLVKTTGLVAMVYVVPLAGRWEMLASPPLLIAMALGWVLYVSQPDISRKEAVAHRRTDRLSMLVILLLGFLAFVAPVVEWRLRAFPGTLGRLGTMQVLGAGMAALGLLVRLHAIRRLGRLFTPTVQIRHNHRLVTTGIYARVRHPSYLGAWVASVGHALVLGAPVSAALAACLMFGAYAHRIAVEEATLIRAFGDAYSDYRRHTARLVPFVW